MWAWALKTHNLPRVDKGNLFKKNCKATELLAPRQAALARGLMKNKCGARPHTTRQIPQQETRFTFN